MGNVIGNVGSPLTPDAATSSPSNGETLGISCRFALFTLDHTAQFSLVGLGVVLFINLGL